MVDIDDDINFDDISDEIDDIIGDIWYEIDDIWWYNWWFIRV